MVDHPQLIEYLDSTNFFNPNPNSTIHVLLAYEVMLDFIIFIDDVDFYVCAGKGRRQGDRKSVV